MRKIAIIDADLIGRKKHRFPNLCCMKIAGYHKAIGDEVVLKTSYGWLDIYDKVYIAKVFTDTYFPYKILEGKDNIVIGGTGFYFDKAPNLPDEIEHHAPDYHLYDEWINLQLKRGKSRVEFKEYLDYSIGYITRGCFRQCGFCVNQKYKSVFKSSDIDEFYDGSRKKICLLDDNFLGYKNWKEELEKLIATNKPFKFKQGLDARILTGEKCEILFKAKYDSDIYFAFDNIDDYDLILEKIKLIRKYTDRQCVFYVLCGYDRQDKYDTEFWERDIVDTFKRINLLQQYGCLPYIMRFMCYKDSPYRGIYVLLARWCNQFSFLKKKSFREYCTNTKGIGDSAGRYLKEYEVTHLDVANKFFDEKWRKWRCDE